MPVGSEIRKRVERLREITGRESKDVPQELIEKEKRLKELNEEITRAKRENKGSALIEGLVDNRTQIKEEIAELKRTNYL